MTHSGHIFDISSKKTPGIGEHIVTIKLDKPGKYPYVATSVRDDDERTAYADAVMQTIDELKGYRTLQRKLIREAILWL